MYLYYTTHTTSARNRRGLFLGEVFLEELCGMPTMIGSWGILVEPAALIRSLTLVRIVPLKEWEGSWTLQWVFPDLQRSTGFNKGGGFNHRARGGRYINFSSLFTKSLASGNRCLVKIELRVLWIFAHINSGSMGHGRGFIGSLHSLFPLSFPIFYLVRPVVAFSLDNMYWHKYVNLWQGDYGINQ
jgi:hypothetical protein